MRDMKARGRASPAGSGGGNTTDQYAQALARIHELERDHQKLFSSMWLLGLVPKEVR